MIDPRALPVLDYIGRHEADSSARRQGAASGYDVVNNQAYQYVPPPKPLTQMTLGEVKQWQQATIRAQGQAGLPPSKRSSAAGRWQFIHGTLSRAQAQLGLPDDAPFTEDTQKQLAFHLLQGRGWDDYTAGRIDPERFANNVALEWAALPIVSGPKRGQGAYDAPGFNQSTGRADEWLSVVGGEWQPGWSDGISTLDPPDFSAPDGGSAARARPATLLGSLKALLNWLCRTVGSLLKAR